jgi:hypothetical protein
MPSVLRVVVGVVIGVILGVSILFGYFTLGNLSGMPYVDCSKSDLIKTVDCLNEEFNSFYIYNNSNTQKILTFSEFKDQGGVCTHASIWYGKQLKKMGYEITPVVTNRREKTAHGFLVVSSKESYCVIDQNLYQCFEFKIRDGTE